MKEPNVFSESLFEEMLSSSEELAVIRGGIVDPPKSPPNCGRGCGQGCGDSCGDGCSGC